MPRETKVRELQNAKGRLLPAPTGARSYSPGRSGAQARVVASIDTIGEPQFRHSAIPPLRRIPSKGADLRRGEIIPHG
jgi:hypothetical protein